ncbi:MAG: hypothetical protein IJF65_04625 [Clostridia bacterium]|nr:hypothetical protein [Clostridia bacterium]
MSYYRECPECHAALDPGERCDCEQARAKCPYFSDRVDFRGVSSIVCLSAQRARVQTEHPDRGLRDLHYQVFCCDQYKSCRFYDFIASVKGKSEDA